MTRAAWSGRSEVEGEARDQAVVVCVGSVAARVLLGFFHPVERERDVEIDGPQRSNLIVDSRCWLVRSRFVATTFTR